MVQVEASFVDQEGRQVAKGVKVGGRGWGIAQDHDWSERTAFFEKLGRSVGDLSKGE